MKAGELPVGIRLELELFDENGMAVSPSFPSKLEQLSEGLLQVSAPMHEGLIIPVHSGEKLNVYLYMKENLYRFKSVVAGRSILRNDVPILHIQAPVEMRKVQRRKFFRFDYSVPVNYRVLTESRNNREENAPFTPTITRNLSGGGLCLLLEEKMPLNQILECELQLGNQSSILFLGKVVRMEELEGDGKYHYEAGVVFKSMEYKDKETIIRFIFREQRKLIKKGLI